jgi:predicted DsbA family dithiol-disulfide isomerase
VASTLGIDRDVFRSCVESEKFKPDIEKDIAEAQRLGINATPAFILGKTTAGGVDGELILGAIPYTILEDRIVRLLR